MTFTKSMKEYLSGPDVPGFLAVPGAYPRYVDISSDGQPNEKEEHNPEYRSYQNYFNNLNYDGSLFDSTSRSESNKYHRKHRVFQPKSRHDHPDDCVDMGSVLGEFDSYIDLPTVFSPASPIGITYHCGINIRGNSYMVGGLACRSPQNYEHYLRKLTKDFMIPPQNVHMKFVGELPPAVSQMKLMTLGACANTKVMRYSSDSRSLSVVSDLKEVGCLLCAAVAPISNSGFAVQGGFELKTSYNYTDDNHLYIERWIVPRSLFFIYDVDRLSLKILKVSVQQDYSFEAPLAFPRFGHRMVGVTVEENNGISRNTRIRNELTEPAVVFIFGGDTVSKDGKGLVALNDFWKCEIFWDNGRFSEEATSTPVGNFSPVADPYSVMILNEDGKGFPPDVKREYFSGVNVFSPLKWWPCPRSFFSMALIDIPTADLFDRLWVHDRESESPDIIEVDDDVIGHTNQMKSLSNKMLILYGGTSKLFAKVRCTDGEEFHFSKKKIMGDVWCYHFGKEKWGRLDTSLQISNFLPFELCVCGHEFMPTKGRLIISGGLQPHQVTPSWFNTHMEETGTKAELPRAIAYTSVIDELCHRLSFVPPDRVAAFTRRNNIGFHPAECTGGRKTLYRSYTLNLETCRWTILDFLYIPHMEMFNGPDSRIIYVCTPVTLTDSKLVLLGGDLRLIDNQTEMQLDGFQESQFCTAISEAYPPCM